MKTASKRPGPARLRALWPDIWALVKPRRGALGLGLLLIVISRVAGLVLPASTRYLIDDVLGKQQYGMLNPLILAVFAATAVQAAASYSLTQLLSKAAQRLIAEMRAKVQAHIGRLPIAYFDARKSGELVSRIMTDVEGVRNLVGTGLVELIGGLLTALLSLFILLSISTSMTVVAMAVVLVFTGLLQNFFRKLRPVFRERGVIQSEVTGRLTESLGGARVIKGYHAEAREEEVFRQGANRLLNNILQSLSGVSLMSLSATLLMGIVGALVMWMGAGQNIGGTLTLGGFVTFTAFLAFLIAPVFQLVNIGTQLTEAIAGLERTREILNEAREEDDPRRQVALGPIRGEIRFDRVSFQYEENKPVLQNIGFVSSPGTMTALVGSSGSGKSTIIGLIAAFYVPNEGTVSVDGIDLATVKIASYRTQIGVVLQDTFLFAGTIRENIAFSKPGASEEDLMRAIKIARVDEFCERFPEKYDTIVGERGVKLSGGQRQRVSIARAILADPRILILDEATSSLDSESEALIQEGLNFLMKGRTTFVIAHRLSTIRRADQILVVEAGEIVERGTHGELLATEGRYRDLYEKQQGLEKNLFLAPGEGDV
ncbi:MAG: ABC transporter ATP-binding protein [Acidobacteriota bacterium]